VTLTPNSPVLSLSPFYGGGWADYGGGWTGGGFWKDPFGLVHIRGLVTGTAGTIVATLPVGFRPISSEIFNMQANAVGSSARVDISSNGQLFCQGSGAIAYMSLSPIQFLAGV
jgi:hypothetical protein